MLPSAQLILATYQASLPIILLISTQYFLGYLILGFIATFSPATSCVRPAAVALILALTISIQTAVSHGASLPVPVAQYGTVAISAWTQVFSAADILILRRLTFEEHVAWVHNHNRDNDKDGDKDNNSKAKVARNGENKHGTSTTPQRSTIWHAVCFALCLPSNTRLLGTKWQINSVYRFYDCSGPIPTPSQAKFLRMRARSLISSLLLTAMCLLYSTTCPQTYHHPGPGPLSKPSDLLHPASLTKYPGGQFYLYALFLGSIFLLHKIGYTLYSLVAVRWNLSPPEHWPPFYGAPSEA
ncbi:hypothetical protein BJX62DRAFT_242264 [Aspergillus germanicus]